VTIIDVVLAAIVCECFPVWVLTPLPPGQIHIFSLGLHCQQVSSVWMGVRGDGIMPSQFGKGIYTDNTVSEF